MKQEPSKQVSASVLYLGTTVVWELHYFRSKVTSRFCFSLLIENYCFLITYQDGKNFCIGGGGKESENNGGMYDQGC